MPAATPWPSESSPGAERRGSAQIDAELEAFLWPNVHNVHDAHSVHFRRGGHHVKVLALLGSPRKGGNSDLLAREALRGAREAGAETEAVYLDDLRIRPIGEVGDVASERDDPRADDDLPALLERFLDAQIVIFATPVYWQGVSAQLKCFLDRLSSYFRRPPYAERFDGKGYAVICTFGADEPDHGRWVTAPLRVCVEVLRGRHLGELCVRVYPKAQVREMPDALRAAFELGRRAVQRMAEYPASRHA